MDTGISKVVNEGNGNAIIFTALIAAAVANTLPTPFDAIYFNRQQKLKQKLEEGKISVKNYWYHDVAEYYVWASLWYVGLIAVLQAAGGDYKRNSRLLIALVGAGLVVGVVQKNINKDEQLAAIHDQQQKALAQAGKTTT